MHIAKTTCHPENHGEDSYLLTYSPEEEALNFLVTTVHRVGETAENQQKSREKTKVAGSVLVGFLRQKKGLYIPSLAGRYDNPIPIPALGSINI